jgi:tetratricopeptide (TPR) repeat protein
MKPGQQIQEPGQKKNTALLVSMGVLVICIAATLIFVVYLPGQKLSSQAPDEQLQTVGAMYDKSVDLANAGKYTEALQYADRALAANVSSMMPLVQANRAGILVELGRYSDAIAAADAAIAAEGNQTTLKSVAWINKGNALVRIGRADDALAAYAKAHELDPSFEMPKI